ncbi:hypothetical protein ACFWTC_03125 [Streptomyces sp. NPDC058619]|uniref:hypothetical protein n=1 Tax=Streptomyces sp. NPDC058619 TaxID=3346559 RepID=UPI00365F32F1
MAHRTDLPQPDEALRRADAHPATLHILMRRVAQWIRTTAPHAGFTLDDLDEITSSTTWTHLKHASNTGRVDRPRHSALHAVLVAAMPTPRDGETRGEYALRLIAASGRPS